MKYMIMVQVIVLDVKIGRNIEMSEDLEVEKCFECGEILTGDRLFCCEDCEQKLMSEDEA